MAEYIDREALLKNFCGFDLTECVKYGNKTKEQIARSYGTLMMYEIADVIEDAPAADVALVVHGEWMDTPNGTETICSYCKADWNVFDNDTYRFNYCPNCGAKMDAEKT